MFLYYPDDRAAILAAGVTVEDEFSQDVLQAAWHRTTYRGTSAQLIDAGVARAEHFPQGRKRTATTLLNGAVQNWCTIRRAKGGVYVVWVDWKRAHVEHVRKHALAEGWIAALPADAQAYRQSLRRSLGIHIKMFELESAERTDGGFRLAIDREQLAEAAAGLFALIDDAPVKYSQRERDAQVRDYQHQAQRLEPGFQAFMAKVAA